MTQIISARAWRPSFFLYCYVTVILLATSFLWQPAADIWQKIDAIAFYTLNGTLEWGGAWTFTWGHLNTRLLDVTWAVVMGLPLLWVLLFDRSRGVELRFASVLVVVLSVLIGILVAKTGFKGYDRISPSGILAPFWDINQLIPGIRAKTGSGSSFPGDHGVAALVYAISIIGVFKSRNLSLLAIFIAAMNTLPRLIGGGHWLSDVVVGGLGVALFVVPFALATPSLTYAEKAVGPFIEKILRPLFAKLGLSRLLT